MRLYEFDSSLLQNLMLLLRNQIGRADTQGQSQPLTYPALNSMLSKSGQSLNLDLDTLTLLYDKTPELANLIKDPKTNPNAVVLATKVQDDNKSKKPDVDIGQMTGGKTVAQMAHSEVQDHYKKISR